MRWESHVRTIITGSSEACSSKPLSTKQFFSLTRFPSYLPRRSPSSQTPTQHYNLSMQDVPTQYDPITGELVYDVNVGAGVAAPPPSASSGYQQPNTNNLTLSDPAIARRAARAANRASQNMILNSRIVDLKAESDIPRFTREEIVLGNLLGRGGFNDVYDIRRIVLRNDDMMMPGRGTDHTVSTHSSSSVGGPPSPRSGTNDGDGDEHHNHPPSPTKEELLEQELELERAHEHRLRREFLSEHAIRAKGSGSGTNSKQSNNSNNNTNKPRYALKCLSRRTMSDPKHFRTGAADLAIETKFLCSLNHPNIIKLRGIAIAGNDGFATGFFGGYFLILDCLGDTLEQRFDTWKEMDRKSLTFLQRKILDKRGLKRKAMLASRVKVCFDLCGALRYLHDRHIIYRDLKPDNVGFDVRGDVKLFDFGLAKEVDPAHRSTDDTYSLSGNTGSLRYMAPEVARNEPYNDSADVYSFAILLWECCALSQPFEGMSRKTHSEEVIHGTLRPTLNQPEWSTNLRNVMRGGWHRDLHKRPRMSSIYQLLRKEIGTLRDGDVSDLEHSRRRSTYVLNLSGHKGGGGWRGGTTGVSAHSSNGGSCQGGDRRSRSPGPRQPQRAKAA